MRRWIAQLALAALTLAGAAAGLPGASYAADLASIGSPALGSAVNGAHLGSSSRVFDAGLPFFMAHDVATIELSYAGQATWTNSVAGYNRFEFGGTSVTTDTIVAVYYEHDLPWSVTPQTEQDNHAWCPGETWGEAGRSLGYGPVFTLRDYSGEIYSGDLGVLGASPVTSSGGSFTLGGGSLFRFARIVYLDRVDETTTWNVTIKEAGRLSQWGRWSDLSRDTTYQVSGSSLTIAFGTPANYGDLLKGPGSAGGSGTHLVVFQGYQRAAAGYSQDPAIIADLRSVEETTLAEWASVDSTSTLENDPDFGSDMPSWADELWTRLSSKVTEWVSRLGDLFWPLETLKQLEGDEYELLAD